MSNQAQTTTPLIAHQMELERLFSNNQLLPRIRKEFIDCKEMDFKGFFKKEGIPENFGFDLLVQMVLHKRCNLPTLVGLLRHHTETAQETMDLIETATRADLVDWSPDLSVFIVKISISQDVQDDLDCFQYPLPMVVEPKELTNNMQRGYFLNGGSVILKNNHHEGDVCLDHLNRMNKIKFTINNDTAKMVKNQWRNLDKAKLGETTEQFCKRKKAFEKYDRTAHDVIDLLTKEGNEFHFTHRPDKRGRTYCQGYFMNYQGTPWNKSIIEFANKETLNEE